jgi:hypothetical protein
MILEVDAIPSSEEGSNWTVVVFKCPRKNWTDILRSLFSELDRQKLALMPHYRLSGFDPSTDSLFFSFRIFRKQEQEESIKVLVEKLLKDQEHEFDPKGTNRFAQYHAWVGTVGWTKEKCEILSKMSRFVLEIIGSETSIDDKEQWTHLFTNMVGLEEVIRIYYSLETILNPNPSQLRVAKYH